MELHFPVSIQDSLRMNLFSASQSPMVRKGLLWRRWVLSLLFFAYGIFCYLDSDGDSALFIMSICLIILAILIAVFYPRYKHSVYKRVYLKSLKEHYRDKEFFQYSIVFSDTNVAVSNEVVQSRIEFSSLDGIYETGDYFFAQVRNSNSYVTIPKQRINNVKEVAGLLKTIAVRENIAYVEDLNWRW